MSASNIEYIKQSRARARTESRSRYTACEDGTDENVSSKAVQ